MDLTTQMGFQASTRQSGDVTVVDVAGPLMHTEARALRELISELLNRGRRKFVLNLSGVNYLDSSGIGELVAAYMRIKASGGHLKMLHLSPRVQQTLDLVHLHQIFEDFNDEKTALRSFP